MKEIEKFPDVLDVASFLESEQINNSIKIAQANLMAKKISPKGKCHNCGEKVDAKKLFCDKDCTEDYELRLRSKKQNAKVI